MYDEAVFEDFYAELGIDDAMCKNTENLRVIHYRIDPR